MRVRAHTTHDKACASNCLSSRERLTLASFRIPGRLRALVGTRADRLPIDRAVRRVMLMTLLGFGAGAWLALAGFLELWPYGTG